MEQARRPACESSIIMAFGAKAMGCAFLLTGLPVFILPFIAMVKV
jgi:hypothetical protein